MLTQYRRLPPAGRDRLRPTECVPTRAVARRSRARA